MGKIYWHCIANDAIPMIVIEIMRYFFDILNFCHMKKMNAKNARACMKTLIYHKCINENDRMSAEKYVLVSELIWMLVMNINAFFASIYTWTMSIAGKKAMAIKSVSDIVKNTGGKSRKIFFLQKSLTLKSCLGSNWSLNKK